MAKENRTIRTGFNPRTHTGCDYSSGIIMPTFGDEVSIHAPTRGATPDICRIIGSWLFQSTHPHGVRQRNSAACFILHSFNPRTHTGCDLFDGSEYRCPFVSIHAPTRGATVIFSVTSEGVPVVSIHAPTRGATHLHMHNQIYQLVSIHAPTRGATLVDGNSVSFMVFQSTHPHGVRQCAKLHIISQ